jgi:tetratricopeptide (TPR) repeat protein
MDGDARGALQTYQRGAQALESLLAKDPANAVVQLDFGTAISNIGNAYTLSGDPRQGLALLDRAQRMFQTQLARDPSYTEPAWFLNWNLLWIGEALGRSGSTDAAMESYVKVLSDWGAQDSTTVQAIVGGIHVKIGKLLAKTTKRDKAAQEYQSALQIAERILSQKPYILEVQYARAQSYSGLGELSEMSAIAPHRSPQQRVQDWTEARNWYRRSTETWKRINNPGTTTPLGLSVYSPRTAADRLAKCEAALIKMGAATREKYALQ